MNHKNNMSNLLRAGVLRYRTNLVFRLAVAASAVAGLYNGWFSRTCDIANLDIFGAMVEFIIFAVLISWMVGREYEDGGFHNKVIAGNTRRDIYASEFLLAILACTVLFLIHAVIFICLNLYTFSVLTPGMVLGFFFGSLFANLAVTALLVALAFLLQNRFVMATVSILLVFGLFCAGDVMRDVIDNEEYIKVYDYEIFEDGYGNSWEQEIEGSEHIVKNPEYVGEPLYTICKVLYVINPCAHMGAYSDMTYGLFGKYLKFRTEDDRWEDYTKLFAYDGSAVAGRTVCALAVFVILAPAGAPCFRRRELR